MKWPFLKQKIDEKEFDIVNGIDVLGIGETGSQNIHLPLRKPWDWISVKNRFPPENLYVLVCIWDGRPKVNMSFVQIAERIGKRWFDGNNGDEITGGKRNSIVTHWMLIPEPPKEKE